MSIDANARSRGLNTPADFWGLVDLVNNIPAAHEVLSDIRAATEDMRQERDALRVTEETILTGNQRNAEKEAELDKRQAALDAREAQLNGRAAAQTARGKELDTLQATREQEAMARTEALDQRERDLNAFAAKFEGVRQAMTVLS
ncbi:MAG: hypothetical protein IPK59_00655 [Rhodospirillaceae bacterium]|nr:hypothetical protein [Rhodospirillaceae bacterium]